MSDLSKEDNYIRILYLVFETAQYALGEIMLQYLNQTKITLPDLINKHQHDIYHYFTDKRCCICTTTPSKCKSVIGKEQLKQLFDTSSNAKRLTGHICGSRTRPMCCLLANSIVVENLDFTLLRFLIINFCEDEFWICFLEKYENDFEKFLSDEKHKLFHLWKLNVVCCECRTGYSRPDESIIKPHQFKIMYVTIPSKCGNKDACTCHFKPEHGLTLKDLKRKDKALFTSLTIFFCNVRKAIEAISNIRNSRIAHVKSMAMSKNEFETLWKLMKDSLLDIAASTQSETEITQRIEHCATRDLDRGMGRRWMKQLHDEQKLQQMILESLKEAEKDHAILDAKMDEQNETLKRVESMTSGVLIMQEMLNNKVSTDKQPQSLKDGDSKDEILSNQLNPGAFLDGVAIEDQHNLQEYSYEEEVQDSHTCGGCGEAYATLDPFLNHKIECKSKKKTTEHRKKLYNAARDGDVNVVQYCLQKGADVHYKGDLGMTPLHKAAEWRKADVTKVQLEARASLSAVDYRGMTPLYLSAREEKTDVTKVLLQAGATLSVVDKLGTTPLHMSAWRGNTYVTKVLLGTGASLSAVDNLGMTPLHLSAREGKTDVTKVLLEAGASLSAVNKLGMTPLHLSAREGKTDVTKVLLGAGATLSAVDKLGMTPLHLVAREGKKDLTMVLLEAGASLSAVDNQGMSPHDVANDNVKELLQKYAASRDDMVIQFPMMGTVEEMKELISKGTFMGYENRVYLAGACNVGKSTLASILIGEEIPQIWKSTNGLNIYFGRNGIDLKDKTMVPLRKGNDSDVLAKVLRGQPSMKQGKQPSKYGKSLPKIEKKTCPPPAIKEKMTSEEHPTAEDKTILLEKTDTAFVKGASMEETHEELPKAQAWAHKMSKQSYITIYEDIKEQLRTGNYQVNIAPSDLIDFGGQKSFDMTHQLFIQHKGEFVLMFNGRYDFRDPLPEYPQGDVTTESILNHWVSSILWYCAHDDDILPIILFAATHSDVFTEKERIDRREKFTKDLQELFQNHEQHKRIIFDDIFFINGKDENDPEINRLKTKLVEVALRQKSWGKIMPMAWVPLDLQLSEMRLDNTILISKEDLTALNRSNEDFALTDTQIEHFLKVQHSFGKILYFDQDGLEKFIIVQPQSLVNILRSFITDEKFWPDDKSLQGILRTMINTGEISKKELLELWSQEEFNRHMPNNDMKEFIIQVLVHLDILVEPNRFIQEQKSIVQSYLVPCIVRRKLPFTHVDYKSVEDKMICLSYKLLKLSIPAALSFKLIGAAMNVWPLKETPEGVCLYHQAAILCIDRENELHISVKDNKIIIYLINKHSKRFISPNIASTVQECLTLTMKNVLKFYHKSFGKSLSTSEVSNLFEIEVGEWCETEACFIPVPEVKSVLKFRCMNKKIHKFPLFWIFDKTQDTCDEKCSGFDTKDLTLCPTDKHLVKLAALVPHCIFYEFVSHLGLSSLSWNTIIEQYRGYDVKVVNFVALLNCRQQKKRKMNKTSFNDLCDALTNIGYTQHVLCQVVKENVGVLEIDNIALQQIPDDDVLRDLSKQVGNCAMQLGVELGLSIVEIELTRLEYPKVIFSQTFDVLKKWKKNREVKPTIRILMKAMQASDPRGLEFLMDTYA